MIHRPGKKVGRLPWTDWGIGSRDGGLTHPTYCEWNNLQAERSTE